MKKLLFIVSIILAFTACSDVKKQNIDYTGHQILGTWYYHVDGCIEKWDFLKDGTRMSKSKEERTENSFSISLEPLESGFYKINDEVLKDNGKDSCSGPSSDKTGEIIELFLLFSEDKKSFQVCGYEDISSCRIVLTRD